MKEQREALKKAVNHCAEAACRAQAADAMHYTQAALNAANALRVLTPEKGDDPLNDGPKTR